MSMEHEKSPLHLGAVNRAKDRVWAFIRTTISHFRTQSTEISSVEESSPLPEIVGYSTDFLQLDRIERLWKKSGITITDLRPESREIAAPLIASWTAHIQQAHPKGASFFANIPLSEVEKDQISSFLLHKLGLHKNQMSLEDFIEAYFIALEEYLEERYGREKPRITQPLAKKRKRSDSLDRK